MFFNLCGRDAETTGLHLVNTDNQWLGFIAERLV